ncbi:MAG: response regulator [Chitinophagaceae bacterium]
MSKPTTVLLIDDHVIVRKALASMVNSFPNFTVVGDVDGYHQLVEFLENNVPPPDILLLDIQMPIKNGFEVAEWMKLAYPSVKMLALSSEAENDTIAKIIRKGALGYVHKSAGPEEVLKGLQTVLTGNIYLSQKDLVTFTQSLQSDNFYATENLYLNPREKEYLKQLCTSKTIKEISVEMNIPVRTLEDVREALGAKLKVHTRQEMVMFAVKNGLV